MRSPCLCRYEDLKQQLMAAQNLAEQEGDQQELARAAAAVARLTFPASGPADTPPRPALVLPCLCTVGAAPACVLCAGGDPDNLNSVIESDRTALVSESVELPMACVLSKSMVHAALACELLGDNVALLMACVPSQMHGTCCSCRCAAGWVTVLPCSWHTCSQKA